jgi:hypothetical protein
MLYGEATCASSTLLVEAVESSETDYMTWHTSYLHTHRYDKLRSHTPKL